MRAIVSKLPGVKSVNVNFGKSTAEVRFDDTITDPQRLSEGLKDASGGRYSMQVRP